MSNCKVHSVRFYKPKPKALYCMTYNNQSQKLALSRSDASIEIWNLKNTPMIEKRFPCTVENYSIEGLAWSGERLFSVGLHALLVEYDIKKLSIKKQTTVTGQTAFCLDVNKQNTHIAAGTEQGYLNIFSLSENEITFEKFLDKQEGRILCLKYDASGNFIASGSMDTIRVWDVRTGHALHKMTTGRSEANKATIVWCLAVTQDFTIVSGDSRGKLAFWDGKVGAQIESYQSHKADILSLCLSNDEKILYCAGIDANIMSYERIAVKGDCYKWVKSIQRKVHEHDVRALVLSGNRLYSGGVDGYLACSYHPPKTLVKYPPILPNYCVEIAPTSRYLLLKYPKHLEIWKMGTHHEQDHGEKIASMLSVKDEPKKLLVLQRQIKTDRGLKREGIAISTISATGKHIAFSTSIILRLFSFEYIEGEEPVLAQCDLPVESKGSCVNAIFTPDGKQLIIAPGEGNLQVINVQGKETSLLHVIDTNSYLKDTITFLCCTPCGRFLIAADPDGNVVSWKQNVEGDQSWKFYCKLPKHSCNPSAISIQPKTMNLVIAYSDHKISEFNLHERKLTDFSKGLDVKNSKMFSKNFPIRNISFDPRNDKVVLLHDDANILILNKNKKVSASPVKKQKTEASPSNKNTHSIHAIKKYKHLVHLGWLSNDEIVAVEVSPLALLEQLPPGFKQNTFGTK